MINGTGCRRMRAVMGDDNRAFARPGKMWRAQRRFQPGAMVAVDSKCIMRGDRNGTALGCKL